MTRRDHLDAICSVLEARLGAAPATTERRLLRPQLRWVRDRLGEEDAGELAGRLGVRALVEASRDEHLARLDADEGLAVLQIPWEDVVVRACERTGDHPPPRCARCGARLRIDRAQRCNRCGLARRANS